MLAALIQAAILQPQPVISEEVDEEEQPADDVLGVIFDEYVVAPVLDDQPDDEEQVEDFVAWLVTADVIHLSFYEEDEEEQDEAAVASPWAGLDGDFVTPVVLVDDEEEFSEEAWLPGVVDAPLSLTYIVDGPPDDGLDPYELDWDPEGWVPQLFDAAAPLNTTYVIGAAPDDGADLYELEWDPEGWIPQIFDRAAALKKRGMLVPWPTRWMTFEQWAGTLIDDNPSRSWPYRPTSGMWKQWAAQVQSTLNMPQALPSPNYYATWQEWALAASLILITG